MCMCVLYQGEQRDKQQIRVLLLFELQRDMCVAALSLMFRLLKYPVCNKLSFTTRKVYLGYKWTHALFEYICCRKKEREEEREREKEIKEGEREEKSI